jgi:hypothetical protein
MPPIPPETQNFILVVALSTIGSLWYAQTYDNIGAKILRILIYRIVPVLAIALIALSFAFKILKQ